jgi:hypothetical protein
MVLVRRKKPVNKVKLFRNFTSLNRVRNFVGHVEVENLIWKVRETEFGIMFMFSDGVVNTLKLEEHGAFWKSNEKHTSVVSNSGHLKKHLKKKVISHYYKKEGKVSK